MGYGGGMQMYRGDYGRGPVAGMVHRGDFMKKLKGGIGKLRGIGRLAKTLAKNPFIQTAALSVIPGGMIARGAMLASKAGKLRQYAGLAKAGLSLIRGKASTISKIAGVAGISGAAASLGSQAVSAPPTAPGGAGLFDDSPAPRRRRKRRAAAKRRRRPSRRYRSAPRRRRRRANRGDWYGPGDGDLDERGDTCQQKRRRANRCKPRPGARGQRVSFMANGKRVAFMARR